MCLILFGIDPSQDYHLILAANRDEFYARPTRAMEFWPEKPHLLAGRDLEAGGTWFAVNRQGRFAALTNFRDLTRVRPHGPSRGEIIPNLLDGSTPLAQALGMLDQKADLYSGFNILAGETGNEVFWYSNLDRRIIRVSPGVHGLSNHFIDTPWPKVARGRQKLESIIKKDPLKNAPLFDLLSDTTCPPDPDLPHTGVGLEWERILAPLFIRSRTYGTRSSTVMRIRRDRKIDIIERTWGPGPKFKDRSFSLIPEDLKTK